MAKNLSMNSVRKSFKKIIGIIISITFIGCAIFFLKQNAEMFTTISQFSEIDIVRIIFLAIILLVINAVNLSVITRPFDIQLENSFWISTTSSFINLITFFRAGAGFRAWFLKKKYGLSYTNFTGSFIGLSVLVILCASGTILFLFPFLKKNFWNDPIFFGVFAFFIGGILTLFFNRKLPEKKLFAKKYNEALNGFRKITANQKVFSTSITLIILSFIINATMFTQICLLLDAPISFSAAIFISAFAFFSLLFTITPGGIGVSESFQMFSGQILGIPLEVILFAALFQRAIQTAVLFILGPIGKIILLKDLKK